MWSWVLILGLDSVGLGLGLSHVMFGLGLGLGLVTFGLGLATSGLVNITVLNTCCEIYAQVQTGCVGKLDVGLCNCNV